MHEKWCLTESYPCQGARNNWSSQRHGETLVAKSPESVIQVPRKYVFLGPKPQEREYPYSFHPWILHDVANPKH